MNRKPLPRRSSGAVLLVVMACLAMAMSLIVGWARIALLEDRQARSAEDRLQAEWLADSAIQRAAAQLLANSEYQGETWRVTAADFGPRFVALQQVGSASTESAPTDRKAGEGEPVLGEALITVERMPNRAGARQIRVRADFPAAPAAGTKAIVTTNRISKQIVLDVSATAAKVDRKTIDDAKSGDEPQ